jgi:transcriptional regulator with XRE-family HTH domain
MGTPGAQGRVGARLRRARQARGLSLRAVEARSGVDHGYLALVETGKRRVPPPAHVLRLALALQLDPRELLVHALRERLQEELGATLALLGWAAPGWRVQVVRPDGGVAGWLEPGTGAAGLDPARTPAFEAAVQQLRAELAGGDGGEAAGRAPARSEGGSGPGEAQG